MTRLPTPQLPLGFSSDETFLTGAGGRLPVTEFRALIRSVATAFDPGSAVVNLCERRLNFLAGFAAAMSRGLPTLLPASSAQQVVEGLVTANPGCHRLDDSWVDNRAPVVRGDWPCALPDSDFLAAVGHTSGTTGLPAAHTKTCRSLRATSALNAAALRDALTVSGAPAGRPSIVATVPSQHMYGLETCVLLPLLEGFSIYDGRPIFPADVASALAAVAEPRVLVTTPVHLRALLESGLAFPRVSAIVSATAPLDSSLARGAELLFSGVLLELFGSTETCVIATRRAARGGRWGCYPGVRLDPGKDGTIVHAPWLASPVLLHDIMDVDQGGCFLVGGRNSDLLEVAGKRASVADLVGKLINLPGVQDAAVLQLDPPVTGGVRRIAALVVAPGMTPQAIISMLRPLVDPVFLPRPLLVVEKLPRNAVGKLPRLQLLAILDSAAAGAAAADQFAP